MQIPLNLYGLDRKFYWPGNTNKQKFRSTWENTWIHLINYRDALIENELLRTSFGLDIHFYGSRL